MRVHATADDIDDLQHVSNLSYLRWVQDVAVAHSERVGWDYEAYQRLGAVFVVRRHEIDYLAPAFEGEELELVTWIESLKAASSVRRTRIERVADAREVVRASTLWAMVAADTGRPTRIAQEIRDAFPIRGED